MAFELNKIHHSDWMNNGLPDKSVQLLIADPPYFEVKGEFDFIWETFDEYLQQVEIWAKECKRLLADNGTLFWWGHAKKIAYSQIIFDKYFNLENSIVWTKRGCQTKKGVNEFRCFAPISERLLMYDNMNDYEERQLWIKPMIEIRNYLNDERLKAKLTLDKMCEYCGLNDKGHGGIAYHWCSSKQPAMIPEKHYLKLQETGFFQVPYSELLQKHEENRIAYEITRRPFNNFKALYDVMDFDQEGHITGNYDHDTCKPETLTRVLILTCSRPKELVFIPFAGSGTEVAMALKEGRTAIGFDTELKYVEMGNKRTELITMQPNLFH